MELLVSKRIIFLTALLAYLGVVLGGEPELTVKFVRQTVALRGWKKEDDEHIKTNRVIFDTHQGEIDAWGPFCGDFFPCPANIVKQLQDYPTDRSTMIVTSPHTMSRKIRYCEVDKKSFNLALSCTKVHGMFREAIQDNAGNVKTLNDSSDMSKLGKMTIESKANQYSVRFDGAKSIRFSENEFKILNEPFILNDAAIALRIDLFNKPYVLLRKDLEQFKPPVQRDQTIEQEEAALQKNQAPQPVHLPKEPAVLSEKTAPSRTITPTNSVTTNPETVTTSNAVGPNQSKWTTWRPFIAPGCIVLVLGALVAYFQFVKK